MAVRVVVGEDEPLVREGIVRVLERAGFEVVGVAGDAPELLRKSNAHKPDIVVTDIEMPPDKTDDGLRAAIEIRQTRPETGVVVLSQFLEDRYPLELVGDRAEGVGYLLKERVGTGRKLFWPAKAWQQDRLDGPATRIGAFVGHRPGRVALLSAGFLAAFAVAATGVKMNYDAGTATTTPAARVESQIARVLPRGVIDPQHIYVSSSRALTPAALAAMRERLAHVAHVAQVSRPQFSPGARAAEIDVALDVGSTTSVALKLAGSGGALRDAVHATTPAGAVALVGGTASVFADVSSSISSDLHVIFPVAAILILLILIAMLRSLVAPLYLLAAVGLEFAATLGASVVVFQHAGSQPGLAFTLPLVLFLFVVAIGTDYNMLIADRLREEFASGMAPRQAVAAAIRNAAPPIAAAGLVLAISFGSLMIYDDRATKQMGFGMAFGILFAAFVVSTLLVPALTALVGRGAWWPSQLAPQPDTPTREPLRTLRPVADSK